MKRLTLPKLARGRKWLMLAIANLVLQTITSTLLFSMAGTLGLVAVIFFQAFLILVWGYFQDPNELLQPK